MFCKKCGERINESMVYCSKCGDKVSGENQPMNYSPEQILPQNKPSSGNTLAGVALGFGIGAFTIPIPVLDVIMGIVALVLVIVSRKAPARGLWIAALILSIIGTISAVSFTLCQLDIVCFTPGLCEMLF